MSSMTKRSIRILHVIGSPKGDASTSSRLAQAFLSECRKSDSNVEIKSLDVWSDALPEFDRGLVEAKRAPLTGESWTVEQRDSWRRVEAFVEDFAAFDKIVLSTPMWNFGLPYKLKQFFDLLVQPGLTFGLNAAGKDVGLLVDRPVQLILTRSSPLPEGSSEDFQLPYLEPVPKPLTERGACITTEEGLG